MQGFSRVRPNLTGRVGSGQPAKNLKYAGLTRPDPRDFESLSTRPDPTRPVRLENLLTRPATRPDSRDFKTS